MNKYLLLFLMLACTNSFAAISKWVDNQGQVHYSDQPPPPDEKSEILRSTSDAAAPAGASAVPAQKSIAEQEADLEKARQAKQQAAKKAAQKQAADDALKTRCENAKRNLMTLQAGGRMEEFNANGERSFVTDDERQQRINTTQQEISELCK